MTAKTEEAPQFTPLSERERQCLILLAQGRRVQDLADEMGTTAKTVEKQIASARKKLGAATREHAIVIAINNRIL